MLLLCITCCCCCFWLSGACVPPLSGCTCVFSDSGYVTRAAGEVSTTAPPILQLVNATLASVLHSSVASLSFSSAGFSVNLTSSIIDLPVGTATSPSRLTIDLQAGSDGQVCRGLQLVTQMCVTTDCNNCNTKTVTAEVRQKMNDYGTERILFPDSSTPVCTDNSLMSGKQRGFRYINLYPTDMYNTSDVRYYRFRVTLSGSFDKFECPSSADDNWCRCQFGEKPVWNDESITRTANIEWTWEEVNADSVETTTTTTTTASAATTTATTITPQSAYRRLMLAVRSSNLSLTIVDFYNVTVSREGRVHRVRGRLLLRDAKGCDDAFLTVAIADVLADDNLTGQGVTHLLVVGETAHTPQTATHTAQTATHTAQTVTQTAQTVTQTAQTVTQTAQTVTQTAQTVTQTAQTVTQTPQTVTQTAQTVTHTPQTVTQTAQTEHSTGMTQSISSTSIYGGGDGVGGGEGEGGGVATTTIALAVSVSVAATLVVVAGAALWTARRASAKFKEEDESAGVRNSDRLWRRLLSRRLAHFAQMNSPESNSMVMLTTEE